jgi:hypothetical protein
MKWLVIGACALALVSCKKLKLPDVESEPAPGHPAPVVEYKKHPLYVILETEPRNDYERTLASMVGKVANVDALQQFCGQWFPSYGYAVADAYMAWRKKHEATLKDLKDRSEAMWADYVGEDKAYVAMVYPHLRKQMRASINKEYDTAPVDKFDKVCSQFPADLASTKWDFEGRWAKEMALVRKAPVVAAAQ